MNKDLYLAKLSKRVYKELGGEVSGIEYQFYRRPNETWVLALRGTGSDQGKYGWMGMIGDLITNVRFLPVRLQGKKRHPAGFYKAARDLVNKLGVEQKLPGPLIITGHSLGGAVALLMAELIAKNKDLLNIQRVVTFGAPKVGKFIHADQTTITQYKYRSDAVTSLGVLPHPTLQVDLGKARWWPFVFKDHPIENYIEDMKIHG